MSTKYNFREYSQDQQVYHTILPSELLPHDHPSRIIDRIVEKLDLSSIYSDYAFEGKPSFHPKMMLKVLFYSYYSSTRSCRKIRAQLISGRADYLFLSGAQSPDFRTINEFRTRHIDALPDLFAQIVLLCVDLDLLSFEKWAIDGQKIHANASFKKSYDADRLEKRLEKISSAMKKILETEITASFTEEVKARRLQKLKKQETELELLSTQLKERNDPKARINTTDKDAPIMTHKDGTKKPSYNQQSVVDSKYGITVAVDTKLKGDVPDDLFSLVEKAEEITGKIPEKVLADSGFSSLKNLDEIFTSEKRQEDFFVPDRKIEIDVEGKKLFDKSKFIEEQNGSVVCPADLKMKIIHQEEKDNSVITTYKGIGCSDCPKKEQCTKGSSRTVTYDSRDIFTKMMREKLESTEGREIYRTRQHIVETGHGDDQKNKGWKQHHLRGKKKAYLEFLLMRIGSNLGKIIKYASMGEICAAT
jgi:transposase